MQIPLNAEYVTLVLAHRIQTAIPHKNDESCARKIHVQTCLGQAKKKIVISRPLPQVSINAIEITKNYAQFPSTVSIVAWASTYLLVAWSIHRSHTWPMYTVDELVFVCVRCACMCVTGSRLHNNGQYFGFYVYSDRFKKKTTIWVRLVRLKIEFQQQIRCDWPFYATNTIYDW